MSWLQLRLDTEPDASAALEEACWLPARWQ